MKRLIAGILLALMLLAGCSGSPLSLLTGGGPNVAANVQAGAENYQTFGQTQTTDQSIKGSSAKTIEQSTGETTVRADKVGVIEVTNTDWKLIALLCFFAGVLFPSHREIARWLRNRIFKKPTP